MRIKAIACDVDGTVMDAVGEISLEAVESIERAENTGIPIILATARTPAFIKDLFKKLDFKTSGPIISENGGIVVNQRTGEEVVVGNQEKANEASKVMLEEAKGLVKKLSEDIRDEFVRRTDVVLIGRMEAIKLLPKIISNRNLGVDITYAPILSDLEKKMDQSRIRYIISVKDPKANKGNGLKIATKMLGMESIEVAAIGDAENDVSMFNVAGFGVAVANADQKLKKVAKMVTKGSYGEGAREAIDFILDNLV